MHKGPIFLLLVHSYCICKMNIYACEHEFQHFNFTIFATFCLKTKIIPKHNPTSNNSKAVASILGGKNQLASPVLHQRSPTSAWGIPSRNSKIAPLSCRFSLCYLSPCKIPCWFIWQFMTLEQFSWGNNMCGWLGLLLLLCVVYLTGKPVLCVLRE